MPSSEIGYRVLLVLTFACAAATCGNDSTGPSPQPCAYSVTASPVSFGPGGGTGSATVTAGSGCTWTARADAGWLSITSGASGTGNGVVAFAVAANGEPASRTGTLTIATQQVSIQQSAAVITCTYSISPGSASTGKDAATGTIAVTAPATCAWTADGSASWLTVTGGNQGSGNGTVTYSVSRNPDTTARTATIRIADQTFTLTQSGDLGVCQYSVAPVDFSPCMRSVELSSQVTAQSACTWTAEPGASWITISSGHSGSGSGTVRFKVSDNYDAPRSGVVMVRWPAMTAGQNLRIAQAGCYYAVSRDTFSFAAAGGTDRFDVITFSDPNTCGGATQDACVWTAQSSVSWITVTSSMPRSGDNPVSFGVAPNETTTSRTGTITVRNKTVRITQAGR